MELVLDMSEGSKTAREIELERMLLSVIEEHVKLKAELEAEIANLKAENREQQDLIELLWRPKSL